MPHGPPRVYVPQELLLAGNQLGDQAARELGVALGRGPLPRLALLSLADNPRLGADGVAGLAAAMAGGGLPGLAALDLARTHAGNEGARHLAQVGSGEGGAARMRAHWHRPQLQTGCSPGLWRKGATCLAVTPSCTL